MYQAKKLGIENLKYTHTHRDGRRNPTQAIDAVIEDEEMNGKQKKDEKEKQEVGSQPKYPAPFHLLSQRAYSETPYPEGVHIYKYMV